jgi:hypothetical protein
MAKRRHAGQQGELITHGRWEKKKRDSHCDPSPPRSILNDIITLSVNTKASTLNTMSQLTDLKTVLDLTHLLSLTWWRNHYQIDKFCIRSESIYRLMD